MTSLRSTVHHATAEGAGSGAALKLSVALGIGAFFLGLLVTSAAPEAIAGAFRDVHPGWAALALAGVALAWAVRAKRWTLMLRRAGSPLRFRDAAVPLMGAAALDNLLPLAPGDAIRLISLQSFVAPPSARQLGALALEKRLDLVAALAVVLASVLAQPMGGAPAWLVPPTGILAAALVAIFAWVAAGPKAVPLLEDLPSQARCGTARDWSRSGLAAGLVALSLAASLGDGCVFFASARALDLHHAAAAAALATGLVGVARMLPGLPGHLGTFDYFAGAAASAFGAPPADAVAFALLSHALLWIPTTATGWWLLIGAARIGVTRGTRP